MPLFLEKKKSLIILIGLLFFHLILLSIQAPLGSESSLFEKIVFAVFTPVQNGFTAVVRGVGNVWKNYFDLRDARKENRRIQKEVFFLRLENRLVQGLLDRYKKEEELRPLLEEIRKGIVYARVIALDMTNKYKSVVINRGLLDGLEKDMIVLDKYGHLVGHVTGVLSPTEARIQLITDSESGTSVFNPVKVLGVVNGNDQGLCLLKYIEGTETRVKEGDELITSGFDRIYPPGILVGTVISIRESEELFKEILVEPFFKIRNLDELAVLKIDPSEIF
jgi:rod shape-determining protein MreC